MAELSRWYSQVHAVVELSAPRDGAELITKFSDFAIQYQSLEINMRKAEDCQARSIVAASAFKT